MSSVLLGALVLADVEETTERQTFAPIVQYCIMAPRYGERSSGFGSIASISWSWIANGMPVPKLHLRSNTYMAQKSRIVSARSDSSCIAS